MNALFVLFSPVVVPLPLGAGLTWPVDGPGTPACDSGLCLVVTAACGRRWSLVSLPPGSWPASPLFCAVRAGRWGSHRCWAACVGLAGAVRLAVGMTGVGALVRAVLEVVCAVWLIRLGRSWTHKGE